MTATSLTVGGFTQSGVSRALIEQPSNAEKGFSHRFVWLFPKPKFAPFTTLDVVDETFSLKLGVCYYPVTFTLHSTHIVHSGVLFCAPLL